MPVYDLNSSHTQLPAAFTAEAVKTLHLSLSRVEHCLNQLTDEQVWWRPQPQMNAIGNLLLHLRGNLSQWIVALVQKTPPQRNRPAEFAQREAIPKRELLANLQSAVGAAESAIASLTTQEKLLESHRVQGWDTNAFAAILHSITHFEGHAQEIICMTRQLLGDQYVFLWTPKTPEQISSKP